jgi:hypothetical protein
MADQSWIITTTVGTGERGYSGDGGPGVRGSLDRSMSVSTPTATFISRTRSITAFGVSMPVPMSSPRSPAVASRVTQAMAALPFVPVSTSPTASQSTGRGTSMSPIATITAFAASMPPPAS